jgi:hypothetical protein
VENVNLFSFPYQWRDSNKDTAVLLKNKINKIKEQVGINKVDIVAHSMGGLVARQYIQSDDYGQDVDQLITLGTPHLGSPESYLKWEAGFYEIGYPINMITKYLFTQEAKKRGYENIYDYIHNRPIESVKELLPVYEYLWNKDSSEPMIYPQDYPENKFLENLNLKKNVDKLYSVEFTNIVGELKKDDSTITGFKVLDADMGEHWEHGYPHGIEIPYSDNGLIRGRGDQTVPLTSAEFPEIENVDYSLKLNSTHSNLPTKSQRDIIETLSGYRPTDVIDDFSLANILLFFVQCPIDIQVISPSGEKIGKEFDSGEIVNEIDLAYYSGFDTEEEFITIPNYEEGEYQIKTQGTGEGEYTVEVASFEKGSKEEESKEKIVQTVEGEASAGETKSFSVNVQSSEGEDDEQGEDENEKDKNGEEDGNDEDGDQSSATGDQDEGSENFDSDEDEDEDENNESSGIEDQSNDNENSDSDEDSDEDEDGDDEKNEDDQSSGISHQVASAEKEMNSDQSSVIRDQEDKTEEESVAKKKDENSINFSEKENKQEKPAVKGQSTRNNPLVIAGMFFAGAVALTLTWTVGKGKKGESNPS